MYTTLGAPSGAFGGSNGDQSGTESLISTLIVPLNCSLPASLLPPKTPSWFRLGHDLSEGRPLQRESRGSRVTRRCFPSNACPPHPHSGSAAMVPSSPPI